MNSRERVLAAIERTTPDRTPRNFWAESPSWNRLLQYMGCSNREEVLTELDIDIRLLEVPGPDERQVQEGLYRNFWGEQYVYRMTEWGKMREDVPGALVNARTLEEIAAFHWPHPDQFDYSGLPELVQRWNDRALLYGFADIWERPALVRGLENMFVDMIEHPDWVHFLARKFTDFYKEDYTRAAEKTRGRIDLFLLISDLGCQKGPLISLKMFREFIAPYIQEMCDHIHSLDAKVLFHSCGSIRPFIPELIDLGVDVLDPIQPVGNMVPETLKSEFGDRLCFHGGIDMQHLLTKEKPEKIWRESERYCEVLGKNGGYILAPAHLFQPDVPPENILAVYRQP
ncbi:MAG: uroporphyrinogen decarboxylase family protein [Thermoguttaceae bacterium]